MRDTDEMQRMALAYKGALRDANPLLGTIEDISEVLGQTDDEPLVEAARRVVAERAAALAEVASLKAELARAPGLRLGRAPTAEDVSTVASRSSDGLAWFLLEYDDGAYWEPCSMYIDDDGRIIIDEVDDDGSRLARVSDAIALDDDRQPCPVGGWEVSNG